MLLGGTKIIDLRWPWTAITHYIHVFGTHPANLNEDRPIPRNVAKVYLDNPEVLCRGNVSERVGSSITSISLLLFTVCLEHSEIRPHYYIVIYKDLTNYFWMKKRMQSWQLASWMEKLNSQLWTKDKKWLTYWLPKNCQHCIWATSSASVNIKLDWSCCCTGSLGGKNA